MITSKEVSVAIAVALFHADMKTRRMWLWSYSTFPLAALIG